MKMITFLNQKKNIFIFQLISILPISKFTLLLMQPPSKSIHIWKQLLLNQDSILLPLAPQLSPLPLYQPAVYKIFTIQFFLVLNSNCSLLYKILQLATVRVLIYKESIVIYYSLYIWIGTKMCFSCKLDPAQTGADLNILEPNYVS